MHARTLPVFVAALLAAGLTAPCRGADDAVISPLSGISVTVSATDGTAKEGADTGTITVTRAGSLVGALTVNLAVSGTALAGSDYSALPASVVIPSGAASATLTITPVQDSVSESTETVIVGLKAGAGYLLGSSTSVTVNLQDDDGVVLTLSASDSTAGEPSDTGKFRITRSTGNLAAALTVHYTIAGSASAGSDYTALSGTATLAANAGSVDITVTPIDDAVAEETETVVMTLASGSGYVLGSTTSATVNLRDNEAETLSVIASDPIGGEPGSDTLRFTVIRTGASASSRTVAYTLSGTAISGTDYTAPSGSVSLSAGVSRASVTITPKDEGTVYEAAETVILTLSSSANYALGIASATGTLYDNDGTDLPLLSLTASDNSAGENSGETGVFTFTRGGATTSALAIAYLVSGTAVAGGDYAALSGTATIPAGATSVTVTVTPVNDSLSEGTETVILTTAASAAYRIDGSKKTATVNLADNDACVVTAGTSDSSAAEPSSTGKFRLTRIGSLAAALTVNYTMSGGATAGSDYATLSGSATIAAGASTVDITLTPVDDAVVEASETAVLTLATGSGYSLGSTTSATITLTDNEAPEVWLSFSDSGCGEATDTGKFRFNRRGSTSAALTIPYTVGGTATPGADYTALSGTVTINAGSTYADVTVTPIADTVAEPVETVVVTLATGTGYGLGSPATLSLDLKDDENPVVVVTPASATVAEDGAPVDLVVQRLGKIRTAITVPFTLGGTASLSTTGGSLSLPVNVTQAVIRVAPQADALAEGNETVIATLTTGSGYTLGSPAAATVTITNVGVNQAPVANAQSVSATEDTAKTITLTGSDPNGDPLTFIIVTQPTKGVLSGSGASRTYTPNANQNGSDSFTFRVNDGSLNSANATVSISIAAVNDTPVANAQSVSATEDTAKAITLTGSDVEGSALTYTVVTQPTKGVLNGSAPNLTYTPNANQNGSDAFTFRVNDGSLNSANATVSISIAAVNDAPVANAGNDQTVADSDGNGSQAVSLNGSASSDVDGTLSTYVWKEGATQIATGATPSVTLTVGTHTIILTVTDNNGATGQDTVVVTVTGGNVAPTITLAATLTTTANSLLINATVTDDSGTPTLAWSLDAGASTASVLIANAAVEDPTITFPRNGTYRLTLTATDAGGLSRTAAVVVTVNVASPFVIKGKVLDNGVPPAPGTAVSLKWVPLAQAAVAQVATNATGDFQFDGLIGSPTDFQVLVAGSN